jgi:hypothetical protein
MFTVDKGVKFTFYEEKCIGLSIIISSSWLCKAYTFKTYEIWSTQGGEDVNVGPVGCNAVWTCRQYQRLGGTYCLHLQGWHGGSVFLCNYIRIHMRRVYPDRQCLCFLSAPVGGCEVNIWNGWWSVLLNYSYMTDQLTKISNREEKLTFVWLSLV